MLEALVRVKARLRAPQDTDIAGSRPADRAAEIILSLLRLRRRTNR
jgi:hypothetical protein